MRLRALPLPLAPALALALAGTFLLAPPAQAACAAPSSKYVAGTARGQDGRDINVQISFSIISTSGVAIGMDGCKKAGYSTSVFLNRSLSYAGATHSSATTYHWRVSNLPSNAASVWIETWPRGADGKLDYRRYGGSMRRKVPVNRGDIRVALPVVCKAGGRTGTIWGRSYDRYGKPVLLDRIHAWSEAPDSQTFVMGFGPGNGYNGSYYGINNLASGQVYSVWASAAGRTSKVFHVRVDACRTTPLTIKLP